MDRPLEMMNNIDVERASDISLLLALRQIEWDGGHYNAYESPLREINDALEYIGYDFGDGSGWNAANDAGRDGEDGQCDDAEVNLDGSCHSLPPALISMESMHSMSSVTCDMTAGRDDWWGGPPPHARSMSMQSIGTCDMTVVRDISASSMPFMASLWARGREENKEDHDFWQSMGFPNLRVQSCGEEKSANEDSMGDPEKEAGQLRARARAPPPPPSRNRGVFKLTQKDYTCSHSAPKEGATAVFTPSQVLAYEKACVLARCVDAQTQCMCIATFFVNL